MRQQVNIIFGALALVSVAGFAVAGVLRDRDTGAVIWEYPVGGITETLPISPYPGTIELQLVQAGPIGRPQGGGNLPQDLDTISPSLTAGTTQTQAGATLCTQTICYVGTANTGDGIKLRQCTLAPMRQLVINNSGNNIQVYGSGTDTINGIATATGILLAPVTSTINSGVSEFTCAVGGTAAKWFTH